MTTRLRLLPAALRRALVAVAVLAFLVPALGGLFGGVCFASSGSVGLGCCSADGRGSGACACCDPSGSDRGAPSGVPSDAPPSRGCCGDESNDPSAPASDGDDEDRCCTHIAPLDEPLAPSDGSPRTLPSALALGPTDVLPFVLPFPRSASADPALRLSARGPPPPRESAACPLVLRV